MSVNSFVPNPGYAVYKIGRALYETGNSIHIDNAGSLLSFDRKDKTKLRASVRAWIANGWFIVDGNDMVSISANAKRYFDSITISESKKASIPVTPPTDMQPMKAKAWVPPKRLVRDDVPEWSKRPDGFSLKTALGKKA